MSVGPADPADPAAAPMASPPPGGQSSPLLFGCDFSSAPSRRKPIVTALGRLAGQRVLLTSLLRHTTLPDWAAWLGAPDARWVGGFDLPFGLPRELVHTLGWPDDWAACMDHYARLPRPEIRATFAAFCSVRPVGGKFAHRATDRPAGSSPSMKWVNPPVAFMLHAGVPLLRAAGATLMGVGAAGRPGTPSDETNVDSAVQPGGGGGPNATRRHPPQQEPAPALAPVAGPPPERIALEAYPGLLAREVLGRRSYKSDDPAKQSADRLIARKDLLAALERGESATGVPLAIGLRLKASPLLLDQLAADASGDALDAVLCLLQAAWGLQQRQAGDARYGLPADADPLEGWIVSA